MSNAQTIRTLATEASNCFETKTRDNGETFTCRKDDAPEWLADLCHAAHGDGDMLPDDFRYRFIVESLDVISESSDDDGLELCELETEADIYTHNLTSWLASAGGRFEYCDDAANEGLVSDDTPMSQRLAIGQYMERREVMSAVLDSLTERADEISEDC